MLLLCSAAVPRLTRWSLWLDEAYTRAAIDDLWFSLRHTRFTMGLYYVVIAGWGEVSIAPWWLRLFSLACAAATLVVTAAVARRVADDRVAFLAPILLAVSPMFVWKASEARSYSLLTLVVVVCWYSAVRVVAESVQAEQEGGTKRWIWMVTALATLGPLVHALFFAYFAGILAMCLLHDAPRRPLRRFLPAILGCAGATLLLELLARSDVPGAMLSSDLGFQVREAGAGFFSTWWPLAVVGFGVTVVGGVIVASTAARTRDVPQRLIRSVPLVWSVVPTIIIVGIGFTIQIYMPRYLSGITPAVAILAAAGLSRAGVAVRSVVGGSTGRSRSGRAGLVDIVSAVAVVVGAAVMVWSPPFGMAEDWATPAELVHEQARPGDGIVFVTVPGQLQLATRVPFEAAWSLLDARPVPVPISPDRPLGLVRRFDEPSANRTIIDRASALQRIWVVDYWGQDHETGLTHDLEATGEFQIVTDQTFQGGVRLLRLDRT